MNAKLASQIVAGIFALASAWLGYAYEHKKSQIDEIRAIRGEVRGILDEKVGKISQLRNTTGLTPDQRQRLEDIATDLEKIDTRIERAISR
jgi:hypothetical protein